MLSSANNLKVLCWMYSLKSFIYTRNRIGPKLFLGELFMLHEFYLIVHPSIMTVCARDVRKSSIHFKVLYSMP